MAVLPPGVTVTPADAQMSIGAGENGEVKIQLMEPVVFEMKMDLSQFLPSIFQISTPPGIGLGIPIVLNYKCPLSVHCGTDTPCEWTKKLPLGINIPLPTFSFPPIFKFPVFGFRFEVPPAIFIKCPAFKKLDAVEQQQYDATHGIEPTEIIPPPWDRPEPGDKTSVELDRNSIPI
jgi:hypothetical protein